MVNFCRECQSVVQTLGETLAVYQIALAENWLQVFFDATSRRQVSFSSFIVGILNPNGAMQPITLSSCIFSDDETSEKQVEAFMEKVCCCGDI